MKTTISFLVICVLLLSGTESFSQRLPEKTLRFSKKKLFVNPYEGCTVGDLNLDGHKDIVSSPYIFFGPEFTPQVFRPNHMSSDYIRANSDHVLDVDRDGLPDIIIGSWGTEGMIWYKNPGNSAAERGRPWEMHEPWEAKTLAITRGKMEMYALHDYDMDGVPEIHTVSYIKEEPQQVWRFSEDSSGNPILEPFVLGKEGGGHGFAWGDVNGDGREDLVCEIGWYERPAGDPFAQSWTLHSETDLRKYHPSCPFVVKDLNEDGRLDIIFGRAHAYGLYWLEQLAPNTKGITGWKQHIIDESWSQVHVLTLADLDNDGDEELVAGKCIWAHNGADPGYDDPPVIYYYDWNKIEKEFTRHTISGPDEGISMGRQVSITDLNNDGWLDIVSPSKSGLWVMFNEGYE